MKHTNIPLILFILVIIFPAGIQIIIPAPEATNTINQKTETIKESFQTKTIILKPLADFNFSLPVNFTNNLIEDLFDILWDADGDSGGGGLLVVAFNFIPGIGSNGSVTLQAVFILSVAGGAIILAKYAKRR